jgi:hypothetical protein
MNLAASVVEMQRPQQRGANQLLLTLMQKDVLDRIGRGGAYA